MYEIVVFVRMKNEWSENLNFNLGLWNWRFHYTNHYTNTYYLWFYCTARYFLYEWAYTVIALLHRRCRRSNKLSAFFVFHFAPQTVVSPVRWLLFISFRINSEKKTQTFWMKKIINKTQHLWRRIKLTRITRCNMLYTV